MFKIKTIPVTPLQQNCRVLYVNKKAIIIDPGGDVDEIDSFLKSQDLTPIEIWLTHCHFDHCGGVANLKEKFDIPVRGHKLEKQMRAMVEDIAKMYQLEGAGFRNCPEPELFLEDGQVLEFEENKFKCLFTPGHSPGHICFYNKDKNTLIAGDTLFQGSIGRTDLPLCNHNDLISSIKNKLYTLPDNTRVMPGHGPDTSIGSEKRSNAFVRG
jgi:glyoxylase-like metal-dependent hydrolase (beta-lactamase superfamily II)